ncbi:hypothetical protein OX283_009345 [Flavobacterium sp. SUN052]|uniref:hypothetical protein n=1 Tax=Flavobacterium sp. SUN052 TaxID=3002441 RepID=UPI00237DA6DE|nr:hypothetical protein [Flavobacterium sp. SUN052]MEC4004858.1 hypothetical protein [Flavobacterium sp. SUN052]
MKQYKNICASNYLVYNYTKEETENCFKILIDEGFLGRDYSLNSYVDFKNVLEKYPNRFQYGLRFKNKGFIISNPIDWNCLGYTIDGDSEDSKYIIDITNKFLLVLENSLFSYIDFEADPPKNFNKIITKKEIKWLFKYNYFGKDFIEKFGKDFFINMPCVSHEFITEHIIKIDLVEDIFLPINKLLMNDVSDYLKTFSIDVNFYNHEDFFID